MTTVELILTTVCFTAVLITLVLGIVIMITVLDNRHRRRLLEGDN